MSSEQTVQAAILFSHYESVGFGQVIDVHRDLQHHAIQCEQRVETVLGVAPPDALIA